MTSQLLQSTLSERLDVMLGRLLPAQARTAMRLVSDPRPRLAYGRYLLGLHWFMRASHPLMLLASRQFAERGQVELAGYCEHHAAEEQFHDDWLLEDLVAAGSDVVGLLSDLPPQTVADMVGSQYYWLLHSEPQVFLGYVYALESRPPTGTFIASLRETADLPAAAVRCLVHHTEEDPNHTRDLAAVIDRYVTDPSVQAALTRNALTTFEHVVRVVETALGGAGERPLVSMPR